MEKRNVWIEKQNEMRLQMLSSTLFMKNLLKIDQVKYVAGVDISFFPPSKMTKYKAVGYIIVMKISDMSVVYGDYEMIEQFDCPYIPGLLGFREVPTYLRLIERIRKTKKEYLPDVILVDGCGEWHPRRFGCACHLGFLSKIPTIGVSKKLLDADDINREEIENNLQKAFLYENTKSGNSNNIVRVDIKGKSNVLLGSILGGLNRKRIYVSIGYLIDLDNAVKIVEICQKYRIPEPIRLSDLRSREIIRSWI